MHISNRLLIQFVSTATALPSPPQQLSYSIEKYGQNMFTVTVQWERPTNDEAGNTNYSYTIAVTDFEPTLLLPDSATKVTLTLSYNEVHTVSVAATNCVGTSSTSELSIYKGNTLLQCFITNMILSSASLQFIQLDVVIQFPQTLEHWSTTIAQRKGQKCSTGAIQGWLLKNKWLQSVLLMVAGIQTLPTCSAHS